MEGDQLIEILQKHPDPRKRALAALELGDLGYEPALEPMIERMKNDDHHLVRRDCAEGLGLLGMSEAVDALIVTMNTDPHHYPRNEAAESLGKIKDKRAIPALLLFLDSEDWEFARASGALALADLNAKETLPAILNAIKTTDDEFTRRDMLRAVHKFRDYLSLDLLFDLSQHDESWEVRKKATEILGWLASPETVEILVKILKTDSHIQVRQEAESSLRLIARDYRITYTSAEMLLARKDEIPPSG
ncbi:MAG: HEAT repeat domain-containing protein [Candidatus Kariarchaeaceae archaeon]|jgi:HEAT repeat protein